MGVGGGGGQERATRTHICIKMAYVIAVHVQYAATGTQQSKV